MKQSEHMMQTLDQAAQPQARPESAAQQTPLSAQPQPHPQRRVGGVMWTFSTATVLFVVLVSLFIVWYSKHKADNISDTLTPQQLQGLSANVDFNPGTNVTYIDVQEGHDRNTSVSNLGTTIPVINRRNFRTFTTANYALIGAAPWAITSNISSNMEDPDLVRYLLGQDALIKAFMARKDVAVLVTDPQALYEFVQDEQAMKEFFDGETFQAVLADEKMVQAIANSRLMSYLLISNSVKYFRDRPRQLSQIIHKNPYLNELRQNAFIRRAVRSNRYLQKIAPVLLK